MSAAAARQDRVRIAPLAMAVAIETFEAWVARARPGDSTLYATGPALLHAHPTVRLVQVLADRAVLRPHIRRRADGAGFDFTVTRIDEEAVGDAPPRSAVAEAKCVRVLNALTRCAERGGMMQSNQELARECALKNASEASYVLRKLTARGAIRVTDHGPNERRVATIVASGAATVRGRL